MAHKGCHSHEHDHLSYDRKALIAALILNFSMFIIELWQGTQSDSSALLADSMDFLSDSFSYIITLYVITKSIKIRAKAAIIKAIMMIILAIAALWQGLHNLIAYNIPVYTTMGWVSILALIANGITVFILYRSRKRDSNMQSVWLCSRNDMIANVMVVCAAYAVFYTKSPYPDFLVALFIAWLGSSSAVKIVNKAVAELK